VFVQLVLLADKCYGVQYAIHDFRYPVITDMTFYVVTNWQCWNCIYKELVVGGCIVFFGDTRFKPW